MPAERIFKYHGGVLYVEDVPLPAVVAEYGTPTFVYSLAAIRDAYRAFASATRGRRGLICYAIKANPNLAILDALAREGAGFDIVSGGELQRVLAVGVDGARIVFSGVGKTAAEITLALDAGIRCFNVESEAELERIDAIARAKGMTAPVSLRVNPDVDAGTHPYISTGLRENKFGIAHERAREVYRIAGAMEGIRVVGIDCHIGSQITELAPFVAALDRLLDLVGTIESDGTALEHIDLGGGLGVPYEGQTPPERAALVDTVFARLHERLGARAGQLELVFEFGRAIVAEAGALLTRVEYLKPTAHKNFAIVDAAMNDLVRPALYDAYHEVLPLEQRDAAAHQWDLVGPVCESGDWLARGRELALEQGDVLALIDAGAYGFTMGSNYNTRARCAEVIVDRNTMNLVRARESFAQLIAGERVLPLD